MSRSHRYDHETYSSIPCKNTSKFEYFQYCLDICLFVGEKCIKFVTDFYLFFFIFCKIYFHSLKSQVLRIQINFVRSLLDVH